VYAPKNRPAGKAGPKSAPVNQMPNCRNCRHFGISWRPQTPYLCRLMGFCSRTLPSVEVLRADGHPCRGFSPKPLKLFNAE